MNSNMNAICTLGLLVGLLVGQSAATSDFSQSCDKIKVVDHGSSLQAQCTTKAPTGPDWLCTKLDLNNCLGSESGELIAKDVSVILVGCPNLLFSVYPDGKLIYNYTEYNLDDVVGNLDGYLQCFTNLASKDSGCN
ncbi:hypothetical protein VMCG_04325 [Cytospora schulzeri]|uniref:Cyanovirin-N domain-containing protein n=1 Tax=Cytospora schulzeri TaxID=448051 RepID=A0A423WT23_9PEZI|nr:hypothetical protein VMCG_04325 [Valsa malicola]